MSAGPPRRRWLWILALLLAAAGYWWGSGATEGDSSLRRSLGSLTSLPYLSWTAAEVGDSRSGVTLHDRERAWPGLNLYASEVAAGAHVVDMDGRVVMRLYDHRPEPTSWKLVKPRPGGTFAALAAGGSVLHLDLRSRLLSVAASGFHHDFDVAEDGSVVGPSFDTHRIEPISRLLPVWDDYLRRVDANGNLISEASMGELIATVPELLAEARRRPRRLLDWRIDALHTNTVTLLPRSLDLGQGGVLPAGSVLTCWRSLDTIAVIDPSFERILWHWGLGELDHPHHPTLLDNGNLLVFDNGKTRGYSRVLELDPRTGEVVWEYRAEPPEEFFSSSRGAAQRLPNGNTLVIESQRGRAFEVTRDGTKVWEFLEPRTRERGPGKREERATIYRMQRLQVDALDPSPRQAPQILP